MSEGTSRDRDGAERRDPYADAGYDPELPPLRPARKPPWLLVWGTNGLTALWAIAVLAALVSGPVGVVHDWFPDTYGFVRLALYAAAFVFVTGAIAVLSRVGKRARARWFVAMAAAVLVLLAAGWLPQRRIDRAAARPRAWPSRTVDGVAMALVTRWQDGAPVFVVDVRCPGSADCMADRGLRVWLLLPGGSIDARVPPGLFVPLAPGEYRATVHDPPRDWIRAGDYLAVTDWTARIDPALLATGTLQ